MSMVLKPSLEEIELAVRDDPDAEPSKLAKELTPPLSEEMEDEPGLAEEWFEVYCWVASRVVEFKINLFRKAVTA